MSACPPTRVQRACTPRLALGESWIPRQLSPIFPLGDRSLVGVMEKPIARLDRKHDILSIFIGHQGPCRFEEELPGLVCRYDWGTGELIGVTIVDFERYRRARL